MIRRRYLYATIAAVFAAIFLFCGCGLCSDEIDLSKREPVLYSVTYIDGTTVLCVKHVQENSCADYIVPQAKSGYNFVCWSLNGARYNFGTPVTGNLVLSALWADAVYKVTFVADGITVGTRNYTLKDSSVSEPDVPFKHGYSGRWETYSLNGCDITVHAVYTPVVYRVNFFDGDILLYSTAYTVENTEIKVPAIPDKPGATGRWSDFSLIGGDINVFAIYDYVKYTVTFIADGVTVDVCEYGVKSPDVTPPQVPHKDGYSGVWEEFVLNYTDITVNAIYTPIPVNVPDKILTDEQGLSYELIDGKYTVTGYTGNTTRILIPEQLNGVPVAVIGDNAFESNCSVTEVLIGENITSIGDYAFYGCTGLKRIVIPNRVETLGVMAFGGCTDLTSVSVGKSVKLISKYAFANCPSISDVAFLAVGDWLICDTPSANGGSVTTVENNVSAFALITKFFNMFLIKL